MGLTAPGLGLSYCSPGLSALGFGLSAPALGRVDFLHLSFLMMFAAPNLSFAVLHIRKTVSLCTKLS